MGKLGGRGQLVTATGSCKLPHSPAPDHGEAVDQVLRALLLGDASDRALCSGREVARYAWEQPGSGRAVGVG